MKVSNLGKKSIIMKMYRSNLLQFSRIQFVRLPCNGHLLKVRSCLLLISWFLAERKRSCNVPACGRVFTCVCARVSARQSACVCACVRKSKWECKCISCAWVRVGEQACSPLVLRTSARVRVKAWKYVFKKRSYVSWSLSPLRVKRLWLDFLRPGTRFHQKEWSIF